MVEGAPLLREYRLKRLIEGSNPSLSATSVEFVPPAAAHSNRCFDLLRPTALMTGIHSNSFRMAWIVRVPCTGEHHDVRPRRRNPSHVLACRSGRLCRRSRTHPAAAENIGKCIVVFFACSIDIETAPAVQHFRDEVTMLS